MPPTLALFLTIGFVVFLFRRDIREKADVTGALWVPLVWLLIVCSRPITTWLRIFGLPFGGGGSLEEGSPVDAAIYFVLIAAGIYVLSKRQVSLSEVCRNNPWFVAFVLYCLLSVLWSDYPFVSFKRWIKFLGTPIMVLVVFTEPNPMESLGRLLKRAAYVLIPFSILCIKYYPSIGRTAGPWATASANCGIAMNKNALGSVCLLLGFFFFWHLLQVWRTEKGKARRNEILLAVGFLCMIAWLFKLAHSSTSLISFIVAICTLLLLGSGLLKKNKRLIGAYVFAAAAIFLLAEAAFGISAIIIEALGRDPTLTGRTELWKKLLEQQNNPIIGVGFDNFWMGDRLLTTGEGYWWQPNEAHNGYLETYLNLGLIGLLLLIGWIIATFRKCRLELLNNFEFGRFRLAILAAVVLYNWAESGFRRQHPIWFAFYLIALEYPWFRREHAVEPSKTAAVEEETELLYAETRS
jgi:exopolysaccharide production protein ExoQ